MAKRLQDIQLLDDDPEDSTEIGDGSDPSDDPTTEPEEPSEPEEKVYTQEEILNSVLLSIKDGLTGNIYDKDFDTQLIPAINMTFSVLHQIGVGPKKAFRITDETKVWTDFTSDDERLEMVKEYVPQKVRLLFDPPTSSFVLEALKQIVSELEWRLYILSQTVEDEENNSTLNPPTNEEDENNEELQDSTDE